MTSRPGGHPVGGPSLCVFDGRESRPAMATRRRGGQAEFILTGRTGDLARQVVRVWTAAEWAATPESARPGDAVLTDSGLWVHLAMSPV